jgi:hypothetical protein
MWSRPPIWGAGDRDRMLFGGKSEAVFSYRRSPCHISFGIDALDPPRPALNAEA